MIFPKATIVFDLDGTLVDTAPDLLASLNAVLTRGGYTPIVPEQLRHLVGHGVRTLFERAFQDATTEIAPERLETLGAEFLDHYRDNIAVGSRPFRGVPETLDLLGRGGHGLGVCTNKPQDLTELLLAELDLARHFPAVHGLGRMPYNKPDPRHVLDVVDALKGDRKRAVMIGDSPVDVAAAKAAGIPVIAMSYGYTPIPVGELGADVVAHDFAELPRLISDLLD
jgi:phosphoglycolate phosphatase